MVDFVGITRHCLNGRTAPIERRRCPDQFVGIINEIEREGRFTRRDPASARPPDLACVLLILESPHKAEFLGAPEPAKGGTGAKITGYVDEVEFLRSARGSGLVLINAVQFQCSLGRPTSEFRDEVFNDVWRHGGDEDFKRRIRTLHRDGDVIVNCCTRGSLKYANRSFLRELVEEALVEAAGPEATRLRRFHPSGWHFPQNRKGGWEPRKGHAAGLVAK